MVFNTQWAEKVESRQTNIGLQQPSAKLVYVGINNTSPDDDDDANLSLQATIPLVYPGVNYATLTYQSYTCTPQGAGLWLAEVNYTRQNPLYTFDIAGGTERITQSLSTVSSIWNQQRAISFTATCVLNSPNLILDNGTTGLGLEPGMVVAGPTGCVPPGTVITSVQLFIVVLSNSITCLGGDLQFTATGKVPPPDFNGAIGVDGDRVNGTQINMPVSSWEETYYFPPGTVIRPAYQLLLNDLAWKKNAFPFRGRSPGSVLFMGARGSQRGIDNAEITFKFGYSSPRASFEVGDLLIEYKRGWDYLWIFYQDEKDELSGVIVKKPWAAYVEEVYFDGDFADLGIGT